MTIAELVRSLTSDFQQAGVPDPRTDAELLTAHVLQVSRGRVQALALMDAVLTPEDQQRIHELAAHRCDRVPLQHLTGVAPFRGLELSVGPGVFVPRPETESVVQHAIDALRDSDTNEPRAFDLCTGSGALALAMAHEVPTAQVWAIEKSVDAHAWAQRNITQLGDGRVHLRHGDVTDLIAGGQLADDLAALRGQLDVVASNPPYVPAGMVPRDPEVRDHDPALALYSGEDGLDLIRSISRIGLVYLRPRGVLVLEHAEHQGAAIRSLLHRDGWQQAHTYQDLTGRDRTTTALSPDTGGVH